MKLEKRNPQLWRAYLKVLELRDVIGSKTIWHGATWGAASAGEIAQAQEQLQRVERDLAQALRLLPADEIAGWDVYPDLLRWGLVPGVSPGVSDTGT